MMLLPHVLVNLGDLSTENLVQLIEALQSSNNYSLIDLILTKICCKEKLCYNIGIDGILRILIQSLTEEHFIRAMQSHFHPFCICIRGGVYYSIDNVKKLTEKKFFRAIKQIFPLLKQLQKREFLKYLLSRGENLLIDELVESNSNALILDFCPDYLTIVMKSCTDKTKRLIGQGLTIHLPLSSELNSRLVYFDIANEERDVIFLQMIFQLNGIFFDSIQTISFLNEIPNDLLLKRCLFKFCGNDRYSATAWCTPQEREMLPRLQRWACVRIFSRSTLRDLVHHTYAS